MQKSKKIIVRPGDKCIDKDCEGRFMIALICDDDKCGNTIAPEDGSEFLIQIPGLLNKVQADLLTGFMMEHKRDIEKSPYKVALNKILEILRGA